jgi:hypothetical protein
MSEEQIRREEREACAAWLRMAARSTGSVLDDGSGSVSAVLSIAARDMLRAFGNGWRPGMTHEEYIAAWDAKIGHPRPGPATPPEGEVK